MNLAEIDAKGKTFWLCSGRIRARYRTSTAKPVLLKPGQPYQYTLDLWHTGIRIPAGSRLRVEVSSAQYPTFSRNLNTGGHNEIETKFVSATQTIFHDASAVAPRAARDFTARPPARCRKIAVLHRVVIADAISLPARCFRPEAGASPVVDLVVLLLFVLAAAYSQVIERLPAAAFRLQSVQVLARGVAFHRRDLHDPPDNQPVPPRRRCAGASPASFAGSATRRTAFREPSAAGHPPAPPSRGGRLRAVTSHANDLLLRRAPRNHPGTAMAGRSAGSLVAA
jgi:hypothetical protein